MRNLILIVGLIFGMMTAEAATVNRSPYVNAAISASGSASSSGTTTLYTAPAGGYGIVNVSITASAAGDTLKVGTRVVYTATGATTSSIYPLHVGPGQALAITAIGGGTVSAVASGVEFKNQ